MLAAVMSGCSNESPFGSNYGGISPTALLDGSVDTPMSRGSISLNLPDEADLSLRLTAQDGSMSKEWARVSDFNTSEQFKVGTYTLEAWHGTAGAEGFECEHFYGSTSVTVRDGETTPVSVSASLAQAALTIEYSDAFRSYMSSWSSKANSVNFSQDETRHALVQPGPVAIYADFVKPNGKEGKGVKVAEFTAQPKTHYTVTIDVNEGQAGQTSLTVSYNDDMETVEHTVDISDMVLEAPAPSVTAEGFSSGDVLEAVEGMNFSNDLIFNISAGAGISAVRLSTASLSLAQQGWPAEINLIGASAADQATLTSLGFESLGLFRNPDKMAVIDLKGIISHLTYMTTDNNTTFTVVVEDNYGRASEPVSVTVSLEKLVLELEAPNGLMAGEDLDVLLKYNGQNPSENVYFEYRNTLGVWTRVPSATFSAPSRSTATYTVTLGGLPEYAEQVTLRAACNMASGSVISNEVTTKPADFEVRVQPNDVYATGVYATVYGKAGQAQEEIAPKAQYLVSTDGKTYTSVTATAVDLFKYVSGLTPGTKYWIRASVDGMCCAPVTFTTEAAAQIPNSDFESSWSTVSSESNWANMALPGWGTNNAMTTSQGGNYNYVRISGTIQTDGNPGKGVLIRSVGWGSGNTAVGTVEGVAKMKYGDTGLLHLGATRSARPDGYSGTAGPLTTDDLECGIDFTSRPSGISFQYKYAPKNSADRGQMEYWIKDEQGNILQSGTEVLNPAGDFVTKNIALSYAPGTAKAAKLYVKFLSTNDRTFLEKKNANFDAPKFVVGGPYMGSQLTIDTVTLNY